MFTSSLLYIYIYIQNRILYIDERCDINQNRSSPQKKKLTVIESAQTQWISTGGERNEYSKKKKKKLRNTTAKLHNQRRHY